MISTSSDYDVITCHDINFFRLWCYNMPWYQLLQLMMLYHAMISTSSAYDVVTCRDINFFRLWCYNMPWYQLIQLMML